MEEEVQDVTRPCSDCGKTIILKAEEWKWWWEKGGKSPAIMRTSTVSCDECCEDDDDDDDDDTAWQSEHRLRRMEGWVE